MSRLLENSKEIREQLQSRNLYTPDDPYNIETPKIVNAINSIATIINPINSFDLSNTILGRLTTPLTPIQQIGIKALSDQLQKTVTNRAKAELVPTFNLKNLIDGDPSTAFITKKIDFEITRRTESKFNSILKNIRTNYGDRLPQINTEQLLIRNTGKGQLGILYNQINNNYYKRTDTIFVDELNNKDLRLNNIKKYVSTKSFLPTDKIYFPDINNKISIIDTLYSDSIISYYDSMIRNQEYGNLSRVYGGDYGRTNIVTPLDDVLLNGNPRYGNDLLWGENLNRNSNAQIGLLKQHQYLNLITKNGLGGNKKLIKSEIDSSIQGIQGSGLYYVPNNAFPNMIKEGNGVRQHTSDDQYNRFAKAIRFDGNSVYLGNPNSVIYNSVIPKFAPNINDHKIGTEKLNLNVMFSIENLAFDRESELFNRLPPYEQGIHGRVMWFAPYDVRVIEQVSVRHDTTNFIGRGEPIYTYNSTERSATLSFKLLVDHPSHVKKMSSQREIANFFNFGATDTFDYENNYEDDINLLSEELRVIDELNSIKVDLELEPIVIELPSNISVYFPNDEPRVNEVTGYIENWISTSTGASGEKYENGGGNQTAIDQGNDFGLNQDFNNRIKDIVNDLFSEDKRDHIKIDLIGRSSKLFNGNTIKESKDYNDELSKRRIESVKNYIIDEFEIAYPNDNFINKLKNGNIIRTIVRGDQDASSIGSLPENIGIEEVKKERSVEIRFINSGLIKYRTDTLIIDDVERTNALQEELVSIQKKRNFFEKNIKLGLSSTFNQYKITDDYPVESTSSAVKNIFQPVFYSQTPEDYHRRLTFLHQCTRQGKPINKIDNNGDITSSRNSVFGKQPVIILRLGDQFHTKAIIESMEINYDDAPWDMNPEGMGLQFMTADISMSLKLIGGQSLATPIDSLQNAISFNYYGNSTFNKANGSASSVANEMENKQIKSRSKID